MNTLGAAAIKILAGIAIALATTAGAHGADKRPTNWPSNVTWYDYSQVVKPKAYAGEVAQIRKKGYADAIDFNTLPLQHAIVRVHGNGQRKIAVFADPKCPYSRKMEQALNKLDNATIYTFVAPLLGPGNYELANQIACQPTNQERAQAYDNWMLNRVEPPQVVGCDAGINKVMSSIRNIKFSNGTKAVGNSPFSVFDNNVVGLGGLDLRLINEVLSWK